MRSEFVTRPLLEQYGFEYKTKAGRPYYQKGGFILFVEGTEFFDTSLNPIKFLHELKERYSRMSNGEELKIPE